MTTLKYNEMSQAYVLCRGCGARCDCDGTIGEPCWGRVLFVPDYGPHRVHRCEGHDNPVKYKGG
jgi:hypothetical protein